MNFLLCFWKQEAQISTRMILRLLIIIAFASSATGHSSEYLDDGTLCHVHIFPAVGECFFTRCFVRCIKRCSGSNFQGWSCIHKRPSHHHIFSPGRLSPSPHPQISEQHPPFLPKEYGTPYDIIMPTYPSQPSIQTNMFPIYESRPPQALEATTSQSDLPRPSTMPTPKESVSLSIIVYSTLEADVSTDVYESEFWKAQPSNYSAPPNFDSTNQNLPPAPSSTFNFSVNLTDMIPSLMPSHSKYAQNSVNPTEEIVVSNEIYAPYFSSSVSMSSFTLDPGNTRNPMVPTLPLSQKVSAIPSKSTGPSERQTASVMASARVESSLVPPAKLSPSPYNTQSLSPTNSLASMSTYPPNYSLVPNPSHSVKLLSPTNEPTASSSVSQVAVQTLQDSIPLYFESKAPSPSNSIPIYSEEILESSLLPSPEETKSAKEENNFGQSEGAVAHTSSSGQITPSTYHSRTYIEETSEPISPEPSVPHKEPSTAPTIPPHFNGFRKNDSRIIEKEGRLFNFSYSLQTTSKGIVSLLDPVLYKTISCFAGGVKIVHGMTLPNVSVFELYPSDAILIIPSSRVAFCDLSGTFKSNPERESSNFQNHVLAQDAYLRIVTISPSNNGAIIFGVEATYFSLYDNANISLQRYDFVDSSSDNSLLRPAPQKSSVLYGTLVTEALNITSNGLFSQSVELLNFSAHWDTSSIFVEVKFISDWSVILNWNAIFKAGSTSGVSTNLLFEAFDILPPIEMLQNTPPFRMMFSFDFPMSNDLNATLASSLFSETRMQYASPRSEITFVTEGNFETIRSSFSARRVIIPGSEAGEAKFDSTIEDFTDPFGLTISSISSFRPTVTIYTPLLTTRFSTMLTLNMTGDSISWDEDRSFPPIIEGSGVCAFCHRHSISSFGFLSNSTIFALLGNNLGVNIFGDLGYSRKQSRVVANFEYNDNRAGKQSIGQYCFVPAFQSEGFVCDRYCCHPKFGSCQECISDGRDVVEVRRLLMKN